MANLTGICVQKSLGEMETAAEHQAELILHAPFFTSVMAAGTDFSNMRRQERGFL
ncbi:MAG: hypothetical protein K2O99_10155 [Lachnospiraceae bacterium]|nr:hypothetical protein [Lachnospiraceae bacterium]